MYVNLLRIHKFHLTFRQRGKAPMFFTFPQLADFISTKNTFGKPLQRVGSINNSSVNFLNSQ